MSDGWWSDIATWSGEISRKRTVRDGPRKLKGDLLVRGVVNLKATDIAGVWSGPIEGYLDVSVFTQDDMGTVSTTICELLTLSIDDDGYRLDFEASSDIGEHGRRGKFDNDQDQWLVGNIDIFEEFEPGLDQLWRDPSIKVPIDQMFRSPSVYLFAIVSIAKSPLSAVSSDDHIERWSLDANGPRRTRDYYLDHPKLRPPDSSTLYTSLEALASGSSSGSGGQPAPQPPPGPPPPRKVTAPAGTATIAYRAGDRADSVMHFVWHCPALAHASFAKEVLDQPATAAAAARRYKAPLCGHCAKLMAARQSEVLFEASDGAFTIYEDRVSYQPPSEKAIVLLFGELEYFSRTGGFVYDYGLKISNRAISLNPTFGSRAERDAAAEQLQNANVPEQ